MDDDEREEHDDATVADALITDSTQVLETNLEECPEPQRARFLRHLRAWIADQ